MVNIFTHTCSNRSGVGAIDSPDRFEHVFHPYCTQEVLGKKFRHEISIVRPQKLAKNSIFFGVLRDTISKIRVESRRKPKLASGI